MWTYRKILSIQKILSPLVSAECFAKGALLLEPKLELGLSGANTELSSCTMKGQLQRDLRRSLCGAAAAANVGLTQRICADLIQMLAMQESKE